MKLLTVKEVAAELGMSAGGVMSMIYDKRLPAVKFGWAWRIKFEDLDRVRVRKKGPPRMYATRAEANRAHRERLANDPVYREKINKSQRERARKKYATDPTARAKMDQRSTEWQRKKRAEDPAWAAEQNRKRELRRAAEKRKTEAASDY